MEGLVLPSAKTQEAIRTIIEPICPVIMRADGTIDFVATAAISQAFSARRQADILLQFLRHLYPPQPPASPAPHMNGPPT